MIEIIPRIVEPMAHVSYLICTEGSAVVIDPIWDVDYYLELASKKKVNIKAVILTHLHGDNRSGHLQLKQKTNATIFVSQNFKANFKYRPLDNQERLQIGNAIIEVVETPGHTQADISLKLFDLEKNTQTPMAVFTGDVLYNGDVGRPQHLALRASDKKHQLQQLFQSIQKLQDLDPTVALYPGHIKHLFSPQFVSKKLESTIGDQLEKNKNFNITSQKEFVDTLLPQCQQPASFVHQLSHLNNSSAVDNPSQPLRFLDNDDFFTFYKSDQYNLLDTRLGDDFAAGFLQGFINIDLDGKFEYWSGILFSNNKPLLIISDEGDEEEIILRLGRIGISNIAGFWSYKEGVIQDKGISTKSFDRMTSKMVYNKIIQDPNFIPVDIRSKFELVSDGIIKNAKQVDMLESCMGEVDAFLKPVDSEIVLYCSNGFRTTTMASILLNNGYTKVKDVVGGINAWKNQKLDVVYPQL
ncbi:MAG: MBL fold metallo-hydrolase [Bacteriovoracaceae bacterium]|nr:MBL fold metallo-hydrolase [Bacteriovoracaceae bacterium]